MEENAEVQQEEEEKVELMEVQESRVKCLNNLAAAHIKLEQLDQALQASLDVLTLSPHNVKALYRAGKVRGRGRAKGQQGSAHSVSTCFHMFSLVSTSSSCRTRVNIKKPWRC